MDLSREMMQNLIDVCKNNGNFCPELFNDSKKGESQDDKLNFIIEDFGVNSGCSDIIISVERHVLGDAYSFKDLRYDVGLILDLLKDCGVNKSRVVLQMRERDFKKDDSTKYNHSNCSLEELYSSEVVLKQLYDVEFFYSEYINTVKDIDEFLKDGVLWQYKQVYDANLCIDKLAKYIIKNNLSPLEAIVFIEVFACNNLSYNESEINYGGKRYERNNNVVSAVYNKTIRCVGYEQFFRAIVDKLGYFYLYEEKKGNQLFAEAKTVKSKELHSVSLVSIKDDKYQLSGNIVVDIGRSTGELLQQYKEYKDVLDIVCDEISKSEIQSESVRKLFDIMKQSAFIYNAYGLQKEGMLYLFDEDIGNETHDFVTFRQIYRLRNDFERWNLTEKSYEEIVKNIFIAYRNIIDINIPTIEDMVTDKEIDENESSIEI